MLKGFLPLFREYKFAQTDLFEINGSDSSNLSSSEAICAAITGRSNSETPPIDPTGPRLLLSPQCVFPRTSSSTLHGATRPGHRSTCCAAGVASMAETAPALTALRTLCVLWAVTALRSSRDW